MAELVIEATKSGFLQYGAADTYINVHDNANAYYDPETNTQVEVGQQMEYGTTPPIWYYVIRNALAFSLAGIDASATIVSATLSLYGRYDSSDTDFDIIIVSGADLASTLVIADYGDLLNDTISRGSLSSVGLLLEAYNTFGLNDTGIADIQAALASGVIRFGLRSSRDISVTTPKLNGADSYYEDVGFYDYLTANKKPKLTVTYTTPSTFIPKIVFI